jgi:hypothetical protein
MLPRQASKPTSLIPAKLTNNHARTRSRHLVLCTVLILRTCHDHAHAHGLTRPGLGGLGHPLARTAVATDPHRGAADRRPTREPARLPPHRPHLPATPLHLPRHATLRPATPLHLPRHATLRPATPLHLPAARPFGPATRPSAVTRPPSARRATLRPRHAPLCCHAPTFRPPCDPSARHAPSTSPVPVMSAPGGSPCGGVRASGALADVAAPLFLPAGCSVLPPLSARRGCRGPFSNLSWAQPVDPRHG